MTLRLGWLLTIFAVIGGAQVPFSHKTHAPLKLACTSCHSGKAEASGFPALSQCKVCHTEMEQRKIPLQRVYRLPGFTFFSHARHKADCAQCHGDVAAKDKVELAQPLKMAFCVACHKTNHAVITCTTCHELGQ